MLQAITVYTDGGARGNPGPAAAAYLIFKDGSDPIQKGGDFLGIKTNNEAEYEAVVLALKALKSIPLPPKTSVIFYSDSQLLVNQLKGTYKIKEPRLAALVMQIHAQLASLLLSLTFVHIPREQNRDADNLVNYILDHTP